jgi:hypothetical protein
MEENFYHSDFEELIKEKADQYKMYPSDKVWRGIDKALRSRRRWYWTGFVVLLSGVSYFAITELMAPAKPVKVTQVQAPAPQPKVTAEQLVPFSNNISTDDSKLQPVPASQIVTSDLLVEDSGDITAAFEIPLRFLPGNEHASPQQKAAFLISGLEPLGVHEQYNIELSWPMDDAGQPAQQISQPTGKNKIILHPVTPAPEPEEKESINWFEDNAAIKLPGRTQRISWQLAFSPTVNYRRLTGGSSAKLLSQSQNIPMALHIDGDIDRLVNHKPALGFELGTHAILPLGNRVSFKGGVQFNYSKYDIRAYKVPSERATIALNSRIEGLPGNPLTSFTDIRNFGGNSVEELKNQYFQLSMPVGFEVRIFGNEKLQFNVASTIQPTYLLNKNTYLITTDFKNYTKAPSLVRRWNVNAGAEAFVSYSKGDVKWQVGPQFRYQLLSSYRDEYPIKEYLMEYGIKVGITKTIR